MPELPDITVYVESLAARLHGATLHRVRVTVFFPAVGNKFGWDIVIPGNFTKGIDGIPAALFQTINVKTSPGDQRQLRDLLDFKIFRIGFDGDVHKKQ